MSLYDEDASTGGSTSKSADITMKFLQAQIQQRRNNLANSGTLPGPPKSAAAPVMDLSGRGRGGNALRPLRPIKATPLPDSAPLLFVPKAALEDKVCIFGEITIENEYQPAVPNDYYFAKKKKDERETKERAAREIAERLAREYREEQAKREKGAAIAPPTALLEETPVFRAPSPPPKAASPGTTFSAPMPISRPFGNQASRGLGVAANIMSKMGYREGSGLGKDEQGMSTALSVEKTGRNSGSIIDAAASSATGGAPQSSFSQGSIADAMKNATKVVCLKNMVGADDIDEDLVPEIKEEMSKYGQVVDVVIYKMPVTSPEDEVRIFVEFTNVAQAIKAFVVQSGRFFAGRPVLASFYPIEDYNAKLFGR